MAKAAGGQSAAVSAAAVAAGGGVAKYLNRIMASIISAWRPRRKRGGAALANIGASWLYIAGGSMAIRQCVAAKTSAFVCILPAAVAKKDRHRQSQRIMA
jgi:hypothetical protein